MAHLEGLLAFDGGRPDGGLVHLKAAPPADLMSSPAVAIRSDASLQDAAGLFAEHLYTSLPVVGADGEANGLRTISALRHVPARDLEIVVESPRAKSVVLPVSRGVRRCDASPMGTVTVSGNLTTLSEQLEDVRLQYRRRRINAVLAQLRERADDYARRGAVPVPLQHAIRDFNIERAAIERRLEEL